MPSPQEAMALTFAPGRSPFGSKRDRPGPPRVASKLVTGTLFTMPLNVTAGGEAMVHSNDPTGRAIELARSATPATARRRTTLAAVARPAAEVAGLLLVEVLGDPRARAAAAGLARSLTRW